MIRAFRDKDVEFLFNDVPVRRFRAIERAARRKLLYLHRARAPEIWLDLQSDYELRVARQTIWPHVAPSVKTRVA